MYEIGDYLDKYTYHYFLNEALSKIPEDIDSREGSIMYDALAPVCYELAESMINLKSVVLESFTATATGQYLDLKGQEIGVSRILSTKAMATAKILKQDGEPIEISRGDRFSTIGDRQVIFKVVERNEKGLYLLECEETGTVGNKYLGQVLPLQNYSEMLEATFIEIVVPGRDDEGDESLRERILQAFQNTRFGGNVADYIRFTREIEGVGDCQIYPVFDGGGTVLVVVLDNELNIASDKLVKDVQETIDPKSPDGRGIAPIGHRVTVKTADRFDINVSFEITVLNDFTVEQLKPVIDRAIEKYFLKLRTNWGSIEQDYRYRTWVFRSQITSIVLGVQGVANVQNMRLNGRDEDILMQANEEKQGLPFLKEVIANDVD